MTEIEECDGCGDLYEPTEPRDAGVFEAADLPLDTRFCPDCYDRACAWVDRDDLIAQAELVEIIGNRATFFHDSVGPIVEHALPIHDTERDTR
jgi:hypothetical protein